PWDALAPAELSPALEEEDELFEAPAELSPPLAEPLDEEELPLPPSPAVDDVEFELPPSAVPALPLPLPLPLSEEEDVEFDPAASEPPGEAVISAAATTPVEMIEAPMPPLTDTLRKGVNQHRPSAESCGSGEETHLRKRIDVFDGRRNVGRGKWRRELGRVGLGTEKQRKWRRRRGRGVSRRE
ncbi:hypothetical protein P7C70_g3013, partial [Phenoliferia sp. Uapishka_3]